jgi:dihydrofolate synthase/folylpolyglutamate synthase
MITTYQAALHFIHSRPRGGKKDTLARMHDLLAALDNPQDKLPSIIHVTGTNGKGSVSTMAAHILQASGRKTGLFISPFILEFRERIQINQQWITESELVAYVQRIAAVLPKLTHEPPTEFEVVTALMILYFSEQDLDAAVIEVGIGGRWDSTNVLPSAKVAVITSVGLDHQAMLGTTLTQIAEQKAGIIHPGMTVVIGELPAELQPIFGHQPITGILDEFDAPLAGNYQRYNTATAVAAVRALVSDITDEVISKGLKNVTFPARYEVFELDKQTVILDGAHNAQGLTALQENLLADASRLGPYTIIFGSLSDKNAVEKLPSLLATVPIDKLWLIPFVGPNERSGAEIYEIAAQLNDARVQIADDWSSAYQQATTATIVMTGSLYLMSDIRTYFQQKRD